MADRDIRKTDTFFDRNTGEIVCITRVDENQRDFQDRPYYYGVFCTGPQSKDDMEYHFHYAQLLDQPADIHTNPNMAFAEAIHGDHVAHCQNTKRTRTVAIRPQANGKFTIDYSMNDLRESQSDLTEKQARHNVSLFLNGMHVLGGMFRTVINQANRDCFVLEETFTRTRVRIEYEMPNAGWMGSWRPQARINGHLFIGLV